MKYKCIGSLEKEGRRVMSPGDIIITRRDELYNITTGVDFKGITYDDIAGNLIAVTDDPPYKVIEVDTIGTEIVNINKVPLTSDARKFKEITEKMLETFIKKNHDYGNSFEQSLDEEGLTGMRIRGGDKWLRFKNLSKGEDPLVEDESIRDTLLDLANYCIMTAMWLDKSKTK